jgi:ankyrin repeat protein
MASESVAPWMPAGDEDVVQITKLGYSTSQAGTASHYDTFTGQDLENLRKEWKDVRTNPEYNFFSRNNKLFQHIKAVIRGKSMTKADISKLAKFLMGDRNESDHNGIDNCIRWYLISFAIEDEEPFSAQHKNELGGLLDPRYLILGILLQEVPQISFELSTAEMLKTSCVDLGVHHPKSAASNDQLERWRLEEDEPDLKASSKDLKSPFHTASQLGLATFVKAMIQLGYHFSKTSSSNTTQSSFVNGNETDGESKKKFIKTLTLRDSEGHTALYYASKKSRLDVITELLDFHWTIACPPDESFSYAVKWFDESVVDKFLSVEELHGALITEENLILSIQRVQDAVERLNEGRDRYRHVTEKLLRIAKEEDRFTEAVAVKIIELELTELWPLVPTTLSPTGLLHTAVRKQKAWFVEEIAKHNAESVTERLNDKYALWHNNFEDERTPRKEPSMKIRTAMVDIIIKKTRKMEDLADILYQSGG